MDDPLVVWTAVMALAASVSAGAICFALIFGAQQLLTLNRSRDLSAAIEIHREFAGLWDDRSFVVDELPALVQENGGKAVSLPPDALRRVATVGSFFERLGALVDRKVVDVDLLFDLITWSAITCWESSKVILLEWRRTRHEKLYENFEFLVALCNEWLKSHKAKDIPALVGKHLG